MKNKILVDYFAVSFNMISVYEFWDYLPDFRQFQYERIYGHYGYNDREYARGIGIHHHGKPDMGVLLELTGEGCRTLEEVLDIDWVHFFQKLLRDGKVKNITRLDIAYDTFDTFDIETFYKDVLNQSFVSRFSDYRVEKGSKGTSVYLGSSKSLIMYRIYDKAAEQKISGNWIRFELQLRGDRALSVVQSLCDGLLVGELFFGVLNNYFRVIDPTSSTRKERCVMADYWLEFIDHMDKLQIFERGDSIYDLAKLEKFVYEQAGNSIKTLIACVGEAEFKAELKERNRRLGDKHKILLNKYAPKGY